MDHYLDIGLVPDPEFSPQHLMSELFSKLHRALVKLSSQDVGISFPGVRPERPALGDRLRLHGRRSTLQQLMAANWLGGMQDYVKQGEILLVPAEVTYRVVFRVQAKSSAERLRRRLMRRHDLDEAEARQRIPGTVEKRLELPYVSIRSQSTGQSFFLFIEHGPIVHEPQGGLFTAYGLSAGATIPWF
ncbi:type I-F CRISPR-associated endoribonuclease Cas6/Csy4 (plasmid) [Paraburkholderia sp. DD10]|uniref:type I-F CRISPR-associated endoribonuclease Cas6/Csy4 n=1 Tax=Paraburkholderia sp. DD10 TaxID=3409691 RepID=UPI003B9DDE40